MKVKSCPKCGCTELGERWSNGRKLEQYCHNDEDHCYWKGEPYTPPKRRITDTKELRIDDFYGWDYILYDRFGHVMTLSATESTEAKVMAELERELKRGENDKNGGPYTGVVFKTPSRVILKGRMFRSKNGKVAQVKH